MINVFHLWISQAIFCTGKVSKASRGFCSPQAHSPGDAFDISQLSFHDYYQ
jgi:hypothetical protein